MPSTVLRGRRSRAITPRSPGGTCASCSPPIRGRGERMAAQALGFGKTEDEVRAEGTAQDVAPHRVMASGASSSAGCLLPRSSLSSRARPILSSATTRPRTR